jgi:2-polyprenyl-6-methoxyphenol hydroxylase-like FAD-dependent oxidoreductase
MTYDVVVAGAGPVGLLLAAELRLAGASVIVLERLTELSQALKAGGINGRSTELLARRGLRDRLEAESAEHGTGFFAFTAQRPEASDPSPSRIGADRSAGRFGGHFAGLLLPPSSDLRAPATTILPQQALEQLLGTWLTELGVPVLRGHEITGLTQDEDGVDVHAVTAEGAVRVRAAYLVGCDGGRSTVRKLAGFDFPGTDPLTTGYQAIVTLDDPDLLPLGWTLTDTGMCAYGPKPRRLLLVEFAGPPADRDAELTIEELQGSLRRVSGTEVTITGVEASARFTDHTRQVTTYRTGRVLLAGDAAHIHPPFGGQGLNLGLQDAANLGWKLAAVVRGWAPEGLLDTYTSERHPVAAAVLTNTRAQISIMLPNPHSRAMRELFGELIDTSPGLTERLGSIMQGLDIHYEIGSGTHPLIGLHMPDLPGTEEAMLLPRPVLFVRRGGTGLHAAVDGWVDRVDIRPLNASTDLAALLVRPDGYVAWAVDDDVETEDLDELRRTLIRWFGAPRNRTPESELVLQG